jgi:hypothetical protein
MLIHAPQQGATVNWSVRLPPQRHSVSSMHESSTYVGLGQSLQAADIRLEYDSTQIGCQLPGVIDACHFARDTSARSPLG